jgi:Tfp pilus assembly protein PilF
MGRYEEALGAYMETMKAYPRDVVPQNGYAETLRSMGRYEEALAAYMETMKAHPENLFARNGYAETLRSMGRYEEALTVYRETRRFRPSDYYSTTSLAVVLLALGRTEEALSLLPTAVTRPEDWVAWHVRGMIELRQGQIQEAARIFEIGLSEAPWPSSKEYFRSGMALVQLMSRQWVQAEETLEEPKSGELLGVNRLLQLHAVGEQGKTQEVARILNILPQTLGPSGDMLLAEFRGRYIEAQAARMSEERVLAEEWELLYSAGRSLRKVA